MRDRVFNFSAGPAAIPTPVLEKARDELLSFEGSGMSIMEMSHRSARFEEVLAKAADGLRELMALPEHFHILFIQGGPTLQFSMIPMNLLPPGQVADHIVTGAWGAKAAIEAGKFGTIRRAFDGSASGFTTVPDLGELSFSPTAAFVQYTSNETIDGVQFHEELDAGGIPVVCDMSSDILSRPIDADKYGLIFAGAQKNIGPSGVTVVIIREDLIERVPDGLPYLLDYREYVRQGSMPNTPNTWGIYLIGLVCDWLREQGGVEAIEVRNRRKAAILYDVIDSSEGFYTGHADRGSRSLMNVTFRLPSAEIDERFCIEAEAAGLDGLRGHRSVGGVRASIYNAMPESGVAALADFMSDFMHRNG